MAAEMRAANPPVSWTCVSGRSIVSPRRRIVRRLPCPDIRRRLPYTGLSPGGLRSVAVHRAWRLQCASGSPGHSWFHFAPRSVPINVGFPGRRLRGRSHLRDQRRWQPMAPSGLHRRCPSARSTVRASLSDRRANVAIRSRVSWRSAMACVGQTVSMSKDCVHI